MVWDLWDKAVEFHGHGCPGLAVGVKACEAILGHPELGRAPYGELMCVTENDACGVDAVQRLLGCSLGKGNLVFKDVGKMAFTFYPPGGGPGLRLSLKSSFSAGDGSKEDKERTILASPLEELFSFSEAKAPEPEPARIFATIICEECGEGAAESRIRFENGRKLCLDCFKAYDRGW
ncbi:MAG: FmdE family protein [Deltaproteobacteria bacterium]|jgi:formylmethanofuran dehydrogenase subunit E|nr:FmdE family protein [Deltaproteobacteria bacterium]